MSACREDTDSRACTRSVALLAEMREPGLEDKLTAGTERAGNLKDRCPMRSMYDRRRVHRSKAHNYDGGAIAKDE